MLLIRVTSFPSPTALHKAPAVHKLNYTIGFSLLWTDFLAYLVPNLVCTLGSLTNHQPRACPSPAKPQFLGTGNRNEKVWEPPRGSGGSGNWEPVP